MIEQYEQTYGDTGIDLLLKNNTHCITMYKDTTEYFDKWLEYFMLREDLYGDETYSSLSDDCFATTNLLGLVKDNVFDQHLGISKTYVWLARKRVLIITYI